MNIKIKYYGTLILFLVVIILERIEVTNPERGVFVLVMMAMAIVMAIANLYYYVKYKESCGELPKIVNVLELLTSVFVILSILI